MSQQKSDWDDYPRIPAGHYQAYCKFGVEYRDFGRHKLMLRFDVLANDGMTVIATLPAFFDRGDARKGRKPHSGRRSRYWNTWLQANGGPPKRGDRLSLKVFQHRMATIEVGDTRLNHEHRPTLAPYSVVRNIVEWHTGIHSPVKRSHSKSTKVKVGIPETPTGRGATRNDWQEKSASETLEQASVRAGIEGESKPLKPKGGAALTAAPQRHDSEDNININEKMIVSKPLVPRPLRPTSADDNAGHQAEVGRGCRVHGGDTTWWTRGGEQLCERCHPNPSRL